MIDIASSGQAIDSHQPHRNWAVLFAKKSIAR